MTRKMLELKEKEQMIRDLKECESIAEDIERAKKAQVEGIEILEQRHKECVSNLQAKYSQYGGRNQ